MTTYDEYSQAVPPAKPLMGTPLYGYAWPVDDNSAGRNPQPWEMLRLQFTASS
jgi:spore germination protein YaaH